MKGKIYLLPVTLGNDDFSAVIPEKVIDITRNLRFFIVEELRSARRYLRTIDRNFPIDDCHFFVLNEHTPADDIESFLEPVSKGENIGLMSEAGLPCIADPGSRTVSIAHKKNIQVIPLSGPSSIILALIASGFNGQNFTFNGYLPIKPADKTFKIKELEKKAKEGFPQIFMETPYRNQQMFESLLSVCNNETDLCIATDITLSSESIRTLRINEWKINKPVLKDRLAIFILY
jgi:16S rRNA (cytidine1402-2'-O)-methyltransferase